MALAAGAPAIARAATRRAAAIDIAAATMMSTAAACTLLLLLLLAPATVQAQSLDLPVVNVTSPLQEGECQSLTATYTPSCTLPQQMTGYFAAANALYLTTPQFSSPAFVYNTGTCIGGVDATTLQALPWSVAAPDAYTFAPFSYWPQRSAWIAPSTTFTAAGGMQLLLASLQPPSAATPPLVTSFTLNASTWQCVGDSVFWGATLMCGDTTGARVLMLCPSGLIMALTVPPPPPPLLPPSGGHQSSSSAVLTIAWTTMPAVRFDPSAAGAVAAAAVTPHADPVLHGCPLVLWTATNPVVALAALNGCNGTVLWSYTVTGAHIGTGIAFAATQYGGRDAQSSRVYVVPLVTPYQLVALNGGTGVPLWRVVLSGLSTTTASTSVTYAAVDQQQVLVVGSVLETSTVQGVSVDASNDNADAASHAVTGPWQFDAAGDGTGDVLTVPGYLDRIGDGGAAAGGGGGVVAVTQDFNAPAAPTSVTRFAAADGRVTFQWSLASPSSTVLWWAWTPPPLAPSDDSSGGGGGVVFVADRYTVTRYTCPTGPATDVREIVSLVFASLKWFAVAVSVGVPYVCQKVCGASDEAYTRLGEWKHRGDGQCHRGAVLTYGTLALQIVCAVVVSAMAISLQLDVTAHTDHLQALLSDVVAFKAAYVTPSCTAPAPQPANVSSAYCACSSTALDISPACITSLCSNELTPPPSCESLAAANCGCDDMFFEYSCSACAYNPDGTCNSTYTPPPNGGGDAAVVRPAIQSLFDSCISRYRRIRALLTADFGLQLALSCVALLVLFGTWCTDDEDTEFWLSFVGGCLGACGFIVSLALLLTALAQKNGAMCSAPPDLSHVSPAHPPPLSLLNIPGCYTNQLPFAAAETALVQALGAAIVVFFGKTILRCSDVCHTCAMCCRGK